MAASVRDDAFTMLAQINWNPTNSDLRKFGWTLIIGFGLIGSLIYWKASPIAAYWTWGIAAAVAALALAIPPASKPFYKAWMGIAFVMGTIVSTFILMIIFYLIFTPIGLLMRVLGRDPLRLKKKSFTEGTYWSKHPELEKKTYERLF